MESGGEGARDVGEVAFVGELDGAGDALVLGERERRGQLEILFHGGGRGLEREG